MNRAERRRQGKSKPDPKSPSPELAQGGTWHTLFDAKPMAEGMPPHFLLYLLNEKDGFARLGKLVAATLWLQSQVAALICINEDVELRLLNIAEHGRGFPAALRTATSKKLEDLSSESLRREFERCFGSRMTEDLKSDLEKATLSRDGLFHGRVALFSQLLGPGEVTWTPRRSAARDEVIARAVGPTNGTLNLALTAQTFDEEISRICRIMDFIASVLKQWNIHYPVFA